MIPITLTSLGTDAEDAVMSVLRSGQLAMGSETKALEQELSDALGGSACIAVSNGTVALTLALAAIGVSRGTEVITTPFSFFGTVEPIIQLGATPVFVDVDRRTANIDISQISAAITDRTVAILPVHLYGRPVDLAALGQVASRHDIPIVQDACQAIGAAFKGRPIGSEGTACFSFYGSKNIMCGEGGLISTDDSQLAEKLKLLRNHGSSISYQHVAVGYNARMTDMQAAILRIQLSKLGSITEGRRQNAAYYDEHVVNHDLELPPPDEAESTCCYHQYTLQCDDRPSLLAHLVAAGVEARAYYPSTIPSQPALASLIGTDAKYPTAELIASRVVSVPVRETLTPSERDHIVEALNSWRA